MTEMVAEKRDMSYIARCKCRCGGIVMNWRDVPENREVIAREVAQAILDGHRIEWVVTDYVRWHSEANGMGCLGDRTEPPQI